MQITPAGNSPAHESKSGAVGIRGHEKEINSLQFSRDGKRLLTSSSDGRVREFIIDLEELVADATRRVSRTLTEEEVDRYAVSKPLRFGPARAP